jgi:hypothetical protein
MCVKALVVSAITALVGCSQPPLRWYTNCGGCGAPSMAPDAGWGPGTCTTQQVGDDCEDAGATCSTTADPCVPVLICTDHDPASSCPYAIP